MPVKVIRSKDYNYFFNAKTGFFARWGATKEDNPIMSPYGPEIADIEISTICNGIGKDSQTQKPCPWCYKSNTSCGKNMDLETFKKVFRKLVNADGNVNKCLTQIAFGIGDINGNPDLWNIMEYCRNNEYNQVVPNITTNGMHVDDEIAQKLAHVCGAVAVSRYHVEDVCYDAVDKLCKASLNRKILVRRKK